MGYNGNTLLKSAGVPVGFTGEQISEWVKCRDDIIHFIEHYIKIVTIDKGLQPMKLYDFQKEIINNVNNNKETVAVAARQLGKCFFSQTKYKVRNKSTKEISYVTAEEFHQMQKPGSLHKN